MLTYLNILVGIGLYIGTVRRYSLGKIQCTDRWRHCSDNSPEHAARTAQYLLSIFAESKVGHDVTLFPNSRQTENYHSYIEGVTKVIFIPLFLIFPIKVL